MALTRLHTVGNYDTALFEFIRDREGFEKKLYLDSKGIATIGIGYALNKDINTIYADFARAGISLSASQKAALDGLLPNTNSGIVSQGAINTFNTSANIISINETQGKNLFDAIKSKYTDAVKNKLGEVLYNSMANTKELIALVDLAYNTGGIGTNLANAIKGGNQGDASWRVAVWYEIRYAYNAPKKDKDGNFIYSGGTKTRSYGLQVRREKESDEFGLYSGANNTPLNDNEAKQVLRFLEAKRSSIVTYLSEVKNDALEVKGNISDLNNALSPAKTLLIADFANGVNIDGKVLIGQGIGNAGEVFADKSVGGSDSLSGTTKNDLIFGERGSDFIDGEGGDDVIYGGSENDTLIGGDGMDILYGESGDDTLLGFYGFGQSDAYQDKLYGGIGDDTYITGTGDIIRDEDNQGRVVYNNIDLSGEKTQVKGESYYQDGNFYYEESGNTLFVRTKSSTSGLGIEIDGWNSITKEALRIKLLPSEEEGVGGEDDPEEPNPTPDPDPKYVTISVSDAQAVESAGTISFVVSLSEVLSEDVSIDFITTDGTAITGSDYVQYGHYGVTIPAGQKSAVYQVVVLNDEVLEDTENFSLTPYSLSYSGSENVLLSNSATGTIIDDDDPQYITAHISDASAKEATEHMSFTVSLSKELERDITITTSLGAVTIKAGERSEKVYSTWKNDTDIEPDETFDVIMTGHDYQGGQYQVLLVNTGTGTIIDDDPEPEPHPFPYDPDEPEPHDPLVLDLNQDGKISTIALEDSQVYFDITGDGVKERVGWVAPQDGFLVYDKNMNGKIEGIGEVFGKDGLSGFAELRSVADTNYDGIIDRRDALFSQLKVWQEEVNCEARETTLGCTNGDGISQSNELKSLSSAGVKNIELNVIGTNINLNGNILSEAGRYGDSTGERELAADIQLLASQKATSSGTPNTYTIDPITETLPQLRGYGFIDNSFKAYNLEIQKKAA